MTELEVDVQGRAPCPSASRKAKKITTMQRRMVNARTIFHDNAMADGHKARTLQSISKQDVYITTVPVCNQDGNNNGKTRIKTMQ